MTNLSGQSAIGTCSFILATLLFMTSGHEMRNSLSIPGSTLAPFPARAARRLRAVLVLALAVAAASSVMAERLVRISAPDTVAAGSPLGISVTASTDTGQGEKIGFFHGQYSIDGGVTWTDFCADVDAGASAIRRASIPTNADIENVMIRVRVAFRGGVAGDVDYRGAAIRWDDTWGEWKTPPTQTAVVKVVRR